ncbi:MAG TPA: 1-deoxy-D-xylulose-5-phosphate reductoisomerase [Candidatus Xenobia bacterium]|nr:1-deoxy-D-xylulose-5-phosphate reductoisomerase [Candidatus Xenobia bacterium]
MRQIAILGSTGSVGRQCLEVVEQFPERFSVVALAAGENVERLAGQVTRFHPEVVSVASADRVAALRDRLRALRLTREPEILWGRDGLIAAATHPRADLLVSATVGVVGLEASFKAVAAGKTLALANKEVLVAAGELVTNAAAVSGSEILPVDSEHNAVHQCLRAGQPKEMRRLILTGSGGPFLRWARAKLERATPRQALQHPNWRMGNRITVDSATLMNKGFEVIEAHWLFGLKPEQIEVVIHPQSTVHSMVEFVDGSVLAQMAPPDMRLPLQYVLTYPDRLPTSNHRFSWTELRRLDFQPPDEKKFPCLRLARQALEAGGSMPCVLNAADEVAVDAFLNRRLRFTQIPELIERTLESSTPVKLKSIDEVLTCDRQARAYASHLLTTLQRRRKTG